MSDKLNEFQDASGKVTVAVFRRKAANAQPHFEDFAVDVPDDMIAIGGGAEGVLLPVGALLTASYPNGNMSAWMVSSKDHLEPQPHELVGYAIGLRINGMTRDELVASIRVDEQESDEGQHPETSAQVAKIDEYVLISGGFKVTWFTDTWFGPGNLATASFPENNFSWTARSKDHGVVGPATIRAYAISIKKILPVGQVIGDIQDEVSGHTQHPQSTANVPPGFALTGAGAEINYKGGPGSLLWKLTPTTQTTHQDVTGGAKDHVYPCLATITTYALSIRIDELSTEKHELQKPGQKPHAPGEYLERDAQGESVPKAREVTIEPGDPRLPPTQKRGRRWERTGPPKPNK